MYLKFFNELKKDYKLSESFDNNMFLGLLIDRTKDGGTGSFGPRGPGKKGDPRSQKVAKLYDARKVAGWKRHEWKPVGLVRGLLIPSRVGAKPPS